MHYRALLQHRANAFTQHMLRGTGVLMGRRFGKQSLLSRLELLGAWTRSGGRGREIWVGSILYGSRFMGVADGLDVCS